MSDDTEDRKTACVCSRRGVAYFHRDAPDRSGRLPETAFQEIGRRFTRGATPAYFCYPPMAWHYCHGLLCRPRKRNAENTEDNAANHTKMSAIVLTRIAAD